MKQYFRGLVWGFVLIIVGIVTLVLNACVGPAKGQKFFEGFIRGSELLKF